MKFIKNHKNPFIVLLIVFLIITTVYADVKITEYAVLPSADCDDDDLIYIVDDPNVLPASKKIARYEFLLGWAGSTNIVTLGTVTAGAWNAGAVTSSSTITSSGTFDVTGANPMTLGSADVTSFTVITDGTGNAEFTLPNDVIGDADIDWGAGAGQVNADDVPESGTNFWAATDGLGGNDTVKDTMIDWGSGAGQVDLADIPGGTAGANTFNFSAATLTMPKRTSNDNRTFRFNIWNPNAVYTDDTQVCIDPNIPAAITITEVSITCNADPATELDWNLKFADTFIGLANATLIVACDTANGVADIDAGFNDPTVPASKCIYMEFDAEPDANITQVCVKIRWDYD